MKIKTSELQGAALDWAVAKAADYLSRLGDHWMVTVPGVRVRMNFVPGPRCVFTPSTRWAQGGPIVEKWVSDLCQRGEWYAQIQLNDVPEYAEASGPTPLVAAMRCFVASKLGDEVEIPKEFN